MSWKCCLPFLVPSCFCEILFPRVTQDSIEFEFSGLSAVGNERLGCWEEAGVGEGWRKEAWGQEDGKDLGKCGHRGPMQMVGAFNCLPGEPLSGSY